MFHMLGEIPKIPDSPKFVFAHIECPHPPFVFGPEGEPIQVEDRLAAEDGDWLINDARLTREEYRKYYKTILTELQNRELSKGYIFSKIDALAGHIRSAYTKDPYISINGYNLSNEAETIKAFISERHGYINENLPGF